MLYKIFLLALSVFLLISCGEKKNAAQTKKDSPNYDILLLVGTYTAGDSKGINVFKFDTKTGTSEFTSEAVISNPSYLAISKNEKYVYAVSENDEENSRVTAFKLHKNKGELEFLNSSQSGSGPCYITIDETGKYVLTADYGGGTITQFTTNEDGWLNEVFQTYSFTGKSIHPERQTKPYLHNVKFSPDEKFLFANDLGTDKIYRFEVSENSDVDLLRVGNPISFSVKAGSGPRHTEFHPNQKFAYTITEISGEVIVFTYDEEKGILNKIQTIKADSLDAQGSGDLQITPNGEYLYASNRLKGDGLAVFSINQSTGVLTKIGYQKTGIHPRSFAVSPDGKLLLVANRDSNNIQVFKIEEGGLLTNLNRDIELSMPVCLKLVPLN